MFITNIQKNLNQKSLKKVAFLTKIAKLKNVKDKLIKSYKTKNVSLIYNFLRILVNSSNPYLGFLKNKIYKNMLKLDNAKNFILIFIVKVNYLKSNVMVNVSNSFGKVLFKTSSGILGFKNKIKIKKIALNTIIKKIKFKTKNMKESLFSIHFLGGKSNKKQMLNKFKKFLTIKLVKNLNLIPFNGCKPKKIKRKKRKKIIFKI